MLVGLNTGIPLFDKRTARELYCWSRLEHKNVLKLLGLAEFRGFMAMVSPWMLNGTVLDYVRGHPEVDRLQLCVDVVDGLSYLHGQNTVHADMKSTNVLVSDDGIAKITDFGSAELKSSGLAFTATTTRPSTMRWLSPERIMTSTPTKEDDVYACGLEITTGEVPFTGMEDATICFKKIVHMEIPPRPLGFPSFEIEEADALWDIVTTTWSHEPSNRPEAGTLARQSTQGGKSPNTVTHITDDNLREFALYFHPGPQQWNAVLASMERVWEKVHKRLIVA
ncbi:Tyrosine kinase specific for activated [Ceratobasidium sp. AG-Ba]|nr:Tyrosine kinase specific for activated [Ceratobasidium sp. AG-Ba]